MPHIRERRMSRAARRVTTANDGHVVYAEHFSITTKAGGRIAQAELAASCDGRTYRAKSLTRSDQLNLPSMHLKYEHATV